MPPLLAGMGARAGGRTASVNRRPLEAGYRSGPRGSVLHVRLGRPVNLVGVSSGTEYTSDERRRFVRAMTSGANRNPANADDTGRT
jgi:hypothetical protein